MAEQRAAASRPPEVDRAAASRRAVAARRERAALKKDVATRVITPQELLRRALAAPDSPAGAMRVTEFLTAIPAIGEGKRDRILQDLGISPVKRLGGLGSRQRGELRAFLDERWPELQPRDGRSRLVVLAGPTAVGKGTVAAHIKAHHPEIHLSVSATTRSPRPGEVDGEHYFFVDDAEFDRLIAAGELLEYATVHNAHRYGTPRGPIERVLAEDRTALLEIDLQGARQVRAADPSASWSSCCRPAGTSWCSGWSGVGPKARRNAQDDCVPRRPNSPPRGSSTTASSTTTWPALPPKWPALHVESAPGA